MDTSNSLVIETRHLSKAYKGVQALKDFNLKLTAGILGPMQQVPGMNFMTGVPQFYLLSAAAGLLLLSAHWRGKQVRV